MKITKKEQQELLKDTKFLLKESDDFVFEDIAEDRVNMLKKVINYHEWRYRTQNDPAISDKNFDFLIKKLASLEEKFPRLKTNDSITQKIGDAEITSAFDKIKHLTPILSLENSYNKNDLLDFNKQILKLCNIDDNQDIEYCIEPKYDGGTVVLVYENDRLVSIATRGNGESGDLITENLKGLSSIPTNPLFSKYGIYKAEVRGEALIKKQKFNDLNEKKIILDEKQFSNARNTATGSLRMKDPEEVKKRGLEVIAFQLSYAYSNSNKDLLPSFENHFNCIKILEEIGFSTPVMKSEPIQFKICKNIQEVILNCEKWETQRSSFLYELDGIVIKINNLDLQKKCGTTSHHPRWASAFKFKSEEVITKIRDIIFKVGRTGAITPIAKLDPVAVGGVKVQNVTLHNEDFLKNKDIRIKDYVTIKRSGDVIPYLVNVRVDLRDTKHVEKIKFPTMCPSCRSILVKSLDEVILRCENSFCPEQKLQRIIFFVSKDAMNISGLGESTIENFHKLGLVDSISDIYKLDYNKISTIPKFAKKSIENLRQSIEASKRNPIYRLLHSLSIHHLGLSSAKELAGHVEYVLDLANWDIEKFLMIKDFGPKLSQNVMNFFRLQENISLLKEMEALGVNLRQTDDDKKPEAVLDGPLSGKTILFTGSLSTMTREQAEARAAAAGATLSSGVSKYLNILVVGEKAGSKLKKAQALGTVEIWTEQEFSNRINPA